MKDSRRSTRDGWVVHLDADIALTLTRRCSITPTSMKSFIAEGCDRAMCRSFEAWMDFRTRPQLQHENEVWVHMGQFPFGTRVAISNYGGYIPIGFFQLWHPATSTRGGGGPARPPRGRYRLRAQMAAQQTGRSSRK